ncbi:hypothetical protein, partial [Brucella sp. 10RB9210]|uniref:hypothetical protein n=1 Tax=Brucella sp. 10RB9210 TaxID=1844037 RepID=UPI0019D5BCA8
GAAAPQRTINGRRQGKASAGSDNQQLRMIGSALAVLSFCAKANACLCQRQRRATMDSINREQAL